MFRPYGARLPPGGGEGTETCYECDGSGQCLMCEGDKHQAGERCPMCHGDGWCLVCGGRGTLPGGTQAWLVEQGYLKL